jgi:N-dimethylarginine dimethylaminohydrolase
MIRVFIDASTFEILPIHDNQNPYIDISYHGSKHVIQQHQRMMKAFSASPSLLCHVPSSTTPLPDIVFCANAGLSLPRLGNPLLLLPNMKYKQRQNELPYLRHCFESIQLPMIEYPGKEIFEGQAELKWFHGGKKAVCGYGYRSTKQTFLELDRFFQSLYGDDKPELLVLRLLSPYYYHLDIAMLEYDDSRCMIHRSAISTTSLRKLEKFLGKENVTAIDTTDTFCLNAVVDGAYVITHILTDPHIKTIIESRTRRTVKQVDTSDFEKSGGSIRCMTLDIHTA